jgi:hypothetical protein
MRKSQLWPYPYLFAVLALGSLVGCTGGGPDRVATSPSSSPSPIGSPTATSTPTPSPASPTPTPSSPSPSSPTTTQAMVPTAAVPITVYHLDEQCNGLVPEKVALPPQASVEASVEAAVGKVIAQSNSPDFTLAGYRVTVANKVATVDLRLPPDAKRPFAAMSSCEQMALFGSVEKTLTSNAALQIQAVKFTSGQKEIVQ